MKNIESLSEILTGADKRADIVFAELFRMGAFGEEVQKIAAQFRQQVFGIINLSTSIATTLEGKEMYDEITKLNNQVKNCYLMLRTLMNLTEFTRYSDGSYTNQLVDISTFTKDIVSTCNFLIRSTGKQIEYDPPTEKFYVSVDPDRLAVAFLNLLSNALTFTREKAQISVYIDKVGDDITLMVSDDGYGIPTGKLDKVYMPFYSYKTSVEGAESVGLGLSVVRAFADASGAKIIMLSKENEGTKVTLKFPHADEENTPLYLESKTSEYMSNRFSPIYLIMSVQSDLKYF